MELDEEIKQKITLRLLKRMGAPISPVCRNIYCDLIEGEHTVNVSRRGKFTMVEIKYYRNGYEHHFLGIAAKNPNDEADPARGINVAFEDASQKLFIKFFTEEQKERIN